MVDFVLVTDLILSHTMNSTSIYIVQYEFLRLNAKKYLHNSLGV